MTNFKALSQTVPPHDYGTALQGALSWLGNRYLLAEPVNRRRDLSAVRVEPQIVKATATNVVSLRR